MLAAALVTLVAPQSAGAATAVSVETVDIGYTSTDGTVHLEHLVDRLRVRGAGSEQSVLHVVRTGENTIQVSENRSENADASPLISPGAGCSYVVASVSGLVECTSTASGRPLDRFDVDLGAGNDFGEVRHQPGFGWFAGTLAGGNGNDTLNGPPLRALTAGHFSGPPEGALVQGGAGHDVITLSDSDPFGGTDTTGWVVGEGGEGNDVLNGGPDDDTLRGGDGNDELYGNGGADTVDGGRHADAMNGGAGAGTDTATYAGRTDAITLNLANAEADEGNPAGDCVETFGVRRFDQPPVSSCSPFDQRLDSLEGFERYRGGSGSDSITGSDAGETLVGDRGDDMLRGGGGDDAIEGWAGSDTVNGGAGADSMAGTVLGWCDYHPDGCDEESFFGTADADVIDYSERTAKVRIQPFAHAGSTPDGFGSTPDEPAHSGEGAEVVAWVTDWGEEIKEWQATERDQVNHDFAILRGGQGPDELIASGARRLEGGPGNDSLSGTDAAERFEGGAGDDTVNAGNGQDVALGDGRADPTAGGADGADTLNLAGGNDTADGGAGDDKLNGGNEDDALKGGAGIDELNGDGGADTLDGEHADPAGDPALVESLNGGPGNDTVRAKDGSPDRLDCGVDQDGARTDSTDTEVLFAEVPTCESIQLENLARPTIGGAPKRGVELAATAGEWIGRPQSPSFQWQRCDAQGGNCVDIAGANAAGFRPTLSEVGERLRVVVRLTNFFGAVQAESLVSDLVIDPAAPPPSPPAKPTTPTQPAVVVVVPRQKLRMVVAKGLKVAFRGSDAGRAKLVLMVDKRTAKALRLSRRRAMTIGSLTKTVGAEQVTLTVRLTRKARAALRRTRRLTVTLAATLTRADGVVSKKVSRKLTLKR